jgi:hypothetical protein
LRCALALAAAASLPARAQDGPFPGPPPAGAPPAMVAKQPNPYTPPSRVGLALLLGGGVSSFIARPADRSTGLGATWDLRGVAGTRWPVGLEVAYVGSIIDVKGHGTDPKDFLWRNGAEADARLALPIVLRSWLLAPFAFGGVGWNRYQLVNESPFVVGISRTDDVIVAPVGGGFEVSYRGVMLDARFTYRPTFDESLFGGTDLRSWNLGVSLGGEI